MARNIFIVNATQVVVSSSHPGGIYSTISGFPMTFDSINYNDSQEKALNAAKATYYNRLAANYTGSENRVMAVITLEQADGRQIMRDTIGTFPVVEPEPEPEVTGDEGE